MSGTAPFTHHRPGTLSEALDLAAELGASAMVLAGGTELVPKMRRGVHAPAHLISINRIDELAAVELDDSRGLCIGAGARLCDVAKHPAVRRAYPALAQACSQMATPQIRNMGTVGGNLVNGSPCADTAGPLLVYEATVALASRDGKRTMPLAEFFCDAGLVAMEQGEILEAIDVPLPPRCSHSTFRRLSARGRVDVAAVSATALVELRDGGDITAARVAVGAVAPTPLRCPDGEAMLLGQKPTPNLVAEAAARCAAIAKPIDDVRATAAYRRAVLPVLIRRVLQDCFDRASGAPGQSGGTP